MNIKPSEVKHLTDLELLKLKLDTGEIAVAFADEIEKRKYFVKLPDWYTWVYK